MREMSLRTGKAEQGMQITWVSAEGWLNRLFRNPFGDLHNYSLYKLENTLFELVRVRFFVTSSQKYPK